MYKKINRFIIGSNFYAFFVNGLIVLMTGAILPYLIRDFNLSYNQGGLLISLQAGGNLLSGIFSGIISEYLGKKATLLLGGLSFTIGFGGILFAPTVPWLVFFIAISGLGWGTVNNLSNTIISEISEGKGSTLNFLHMFYAVGAFIAPFFVGMALKLNFNWRIPVAVVAILSAVLVIVFLFMPMAPGKQTAAKGGKVSLEFLKEKRYYLFMAILFCYVGAETSINGWLVTYMVNAGILSEVIAQTVLSLLWVVVIFGRLFCAYVSNKVKKEIVVACCCIGEAIFFTVLLLTRNPLLITIFIMGLGLCQAGIYPTTVANASGLLKGSPVANGLLFSCGGLGASVIPFIVGVVAQKLGIYMGMMIIGVAVLLLLVLTLLNAFNRVGTSTAKAE